MAIKKVDPNFDGDYYDNLIFGEPLTLVPEGSIETPGDAAEQDAAPSVEPETGGPAEQAQETTPYQQPAKPAQPSADQPPVRPTNS